MENTLFRRRQQHQDRWSAFGSESGILSLSDKPSAKELKQLELFQEFSEKFLERISPDVSIATWEKGAVLFEQGSYVDLAFVILEGEVIVTLQEPQQAPAQPIFAARDTLAAPISEPGEAEVELPVEGTLYYQRTQAVHQTGRVAFLSTLDFDLPAGETLRLGPGEIFGEIGALNGWPMGVTAETATECRLVQVRVPALRQMKKASPALKETVDRVYRRRSLRNQLAVSPLFRGCSREFIERLAGEVDLISCEPGEIVVNEGDPAEAIYMVRSGFMKLSKKTGAGQRAVSYVSKAMTFGEVELLVDEISDWTLTVSSVGYSELIRISGPDFRQVLRLHPGMEKALWSSALAQIKETRTRLKLLRQSEFLEFSLDRGLVEGNSILVIDLNHCTRCDECVRACSDTHGGWPRFIREGEKYENLLIARACYHCEDPVCLIGCPTGAIRRANVGSVVEIKEEICIGCGNCAGNCPYDAIVTRPTGTQWDADALPRSLRGRDRQVAAKCDLCYDSGKGPACVRNCPQGCAFRVGSTEEFQRLLQPRKGDD